MSNLYSTEADIDCTITVSARRQLARSELCRLVMIDLCGETVMEIPGFDCDDPPGFPNMDLYLEYYKCRLGAHLNIKFPDLPILSAREIANALIITLRLANDFHRDACQDQELSNPTDYVTGYVIDIHVDIWEGDDDEDDEDMAFAESFDEARSRPKPATVESVKDLLSSMKYDDGDMFEIGWSCTDHQCVICMDEIQTRKSSLNMPCSHVFHQDCLVQWLGTSHVCPLCRYRMPTDH